MVSSHHLQHWQTYLLLPGGEPLGAPAPQQGNAKNLVQKLKEGEGDDYFNLTSLTPTHLQTHIHIFTKRWSGSLCVA